MTSVAKTTYTANTAALVDGQTIDAADVSTPITDVLNNDKQGRLSVSATDTYLKHLQDAISVDGTGLTKALLTGGGDEALQLAINAKLLALIAFLTAGGKLTATTGLDSGAAANGYVATANGSGAVSWAAASGGGAAPIDITVTAGETLALRDLVFVDTDNKAYKIDTNNNPVKCGQIRGVVNEAAGIASGATGSVRVQGAVSGFTGLTAWADVWASTTAGGYTQTRPTLTAGGGQIAILRIGYAVSTTDVMVWQSPVQFQRRESLANTGQATVLHYPDAAARRRWCCAYASLSTAGTSLTSYDSTNQDSGTNLNGPSAAGGTTAITASGAAFSVGNNGSANVHAAEQFQIADGNLSQITFKFGASNGTPTGTITWELQSDAAGAPSGTVLATGTHTPTASATNTVNITGGILLASGTYYWLVIKPTNTQSTSNAWTWQASSTSTYASGYASQWNGSGWVNYTSQDMECSITTAAITVRAKISQSFQVVGTQTVANVRLWLKKTGSPTGTMTLRIETDSAGSPSGTLAHANATTTSAESALSASYGWITFTFSVPFTISGSTTYHIVLSTDRAASGSNYVTWGADASSPGYASGQMLGYVSSAWSTEGKDGVFDVTGQGTVFEAPRSVDAWDSTLATILGRYDDGAGGNADTQTTFKNQLGVTTDVTVVVELP